MSNKEPGTHVLTEAWKTMEMQFCKTLTSAVLQSLSSFVQLLNMSTLVHDAVCGCTNALISPKSDKKTSRIVPSWARGFLWRSPYSVLRPDLECSLERKLLMMGCTTGFITSLQTRHAQAPLTVVKKNPSASHSSWKLGFLSFSAIVLESAMSCFSPHLPPPPCYVSYF